jgi:glycosyl transferase family 2
VEEMAEGGVVKLEIMCPSMRGHEAAVATWKETASSELYVLVDETVEGAEAGFLRKCDKFWRTSEADVIGYLHSDLFIHEYGWDKRVLSEFTKPDVGVVGFLGATRLGHPDIYKIPYVHTQLARFDVWSNFTDWRVHGQEEKGSRRVAVVDSCAVFVRRTVLERVGGWPVGRYPNNAHCSDLWLCCVARRLGLHVRLVGISCTHRSGGKGEAGSRWLAAHGTDLVHHRQAHELVYEDFRDVLPVEVEG